MRGAFVVQLGPESQPSKGRFEGWVQEVDSCTERRFRSGGELLKFIGERFELMVAPAKKLKESNCDEQVTPSKRSSAKKENQYENLTDFSFSNRAAGEPGQLIRLPGLWKRTSFARSNCAESCLE